MENYLKERKLESEKIHLESKSKVLKENLVTVIGKINKIREEMYALEDDMIVFRAKATAARVAQQANGTYSKRRIAKASPEVEAIMGSVNVNS